MRKALIVLFLCSVAALFAKGQQINNPLQANLTAQSTDCSVANSCAWQLVTMSAGQSVVTLAGTFSGTFLVEQTNNGTTWTTAATLTSAGTTTYNQNGFTAIRVRCSAYTSGTATVTVSTGSGGSSGGGSGSGNGVGSGASPVMGYYLTNVCLVANTGLCFFTPANIIVDQTCSWTNASTTITCTDNPFTSTAVDGGKIVMGWNTCQADNLTWGGGISTTAAPTISTITDSNHAVISATPSNTSGANACFIFGGSDDAGWSAMETAYSTQVGICPKVHLAAANYGITSPHGNTQPNGCKVTPAMVKTTGSFGNVILNAGFEMEGRGSGATYIYLFPSFPNGDACNHAPGGSTYTACFAMPVMSKWRDFHISGGGQLSCGNLATSKNIIAMTVAEMEGITLSNFCFTQSNNNVGIAADNQSFLVHVNNSGFGDIGVQNQGVASYGLRLVIENSPTANFNEQGSGGTNTNFLCDQCIFGGSYLAESLAVFQNHGIVRFNQTIFSDTVSAGANLNNVKIYYAPSGGTAYFDQSHFQHSGTGTGSTAIHMGAVANTVYLHQTYLQPYPSGFTLAGCNSASCVVHDTLGNTFQPGFFANQGGTIDSPQLLVGSCTGVGTASSTLGLYGTGPNVTATTCTSTTLGSGTVMKGTGTLFSLAVTATAAGTNASSGVVTVLKNGSTTTITCTIGTGTSCQDFTHTVSYVAGDLISMQFTTQTADTLAGIKANVMTGQ